MENLNPTYRYLKGYVLDPGFSLQLDTLSINEVIYKIPWENTLPGPLGEYIEVIDFDPPSNCFYPPIDLNATDVLANRGLSPSEGNPKFHQQIIYAVSMKVISHFERALGRKIVWRTYFPEDEYGKSYPNNKFIKALRIYPHAIRDANAYYDPKKQSLLFGYFNSSNSYMGSNFPGGVVFTCLSPDIVAHEITHALLDGIHYRFVVNTNPDVPAFHEGFSDIIALLSRFSFKLLVEHQLSKSRGGFNEYNLMGELATQFGNAIEIRGALRSAIGGWNSKKNKWEKFIPNPNDYNTKFECHDRGAILVGAIFDAFNRLYQHKTADLIRISTSGTGVLPDGNLNTDLVKRLANEASDIAEHLLHVCIRALDYCPPVDITFGDYLRALITADLDIAPEDEQGYRISLIEAFRERGIFPDRVNTLSVESLQWAKPHFNRTELKVFNYLASFLSEKIQPLLTITNRESLFKHTQQLQAEFHNEFFIKKPSSYTANAWEALMSKLGMTSRDFSINYNGIIYKITKPKTQVLKIIPAFRFGREGKLIQQVIVILSQRVAIRNEDNVEIKFYGGCTLIFNLSNLNKFNYLDNKIVENVIDYIIYKNIKSQRRFDRQIEYTESGDKYGFSSYNSQFQDDISNLNINFKNLHFH